MVPAARHAAGFHSVKDGARSLSGSALFSVGSALQARQFANPRGFIGWVMHNGHHLGRVRHAHSTPSCQWGVEQTWSSSGQGQVTATVEYFYDWKCTQPYQLFTLNADFPPNSDGNGLATQEVWNRQGSAIAYNTDTVTYEILSSGKPGGSEPAGSGDLLTVQQAYANGPSATPFAQTGVACATGLGYDVWCGTGDVNTVTESSGGGGKAGGSGGEMLGFQQSSFGNFTTSGGGGKQIVRPHWGGQQQTLPLSVSASGYSGGVGALTMSPSGVGFQINGGQEDDTLNGTVTLSFGGWSGWGGWAALSSLNLTLADLNNGDTATLTSSNWGRITGTVTNANGQTVATISVDIDGCGTISYTGGGSSQIVDWVVTD